jgi:hypothetical protein
MRVLAAGSQVQTADEGLVLSVDLAVGKQRVGGLRADCAQQDVRRGEPGMPGQDRALVPCSARGQVRVVGVGGLPGAVGLIP